MNWMTLLVFSAFFFQAPTQQDPASPAERVTREDQKSAVIRAVGIGRPPGGKSAAQARLMATRAAEVVALRNLVGIVQGQQISDGPDGTLNATTEGFIAGYVVLSPRVLPDETVEVVVELPVAKAYGNFSALSARMTLLESDLQQTQETLAETRKQLDVAEAARQEAVARAAEMKSALEAAGSWAKALLSELERLKSEVEELIKKLP